MKLIPEPCVGHASFDERFELRWRVTSSMYTASIFTETVSALVEFPERSSTVILRADILNVRTEFRAENNEHGYLKPNADWLLNKIVERKILPRNPRIDKDMLQMCYFYNRPTLEADDQVLIIFEPVQKSDIPFYHPHLDALAFHYTPDKFTVSYVPLRTTNDIGVTFNSTQIRNRLDRTMFQLATIITKHSIGNMNNYQKRVQHDLVVRKHDWQDLYTDLKGRYASEYMSKWVESTDPQKHVFEDLGIASFLLNLRIQIQRTRQADQALTFVDLGCGNGLLVEILIREGVEIYGFDARRRKSWSIYSQAAQAALFEMVLYPQILHSSQDQHPGIIVQRGTVGAPQAGIQLNYGLFDANQFLIGNHADELTPYIPLMAAIASLDNCINGDENVIQTAGFMIIPCCTHTFSGGKHNGLSTLGGRYASYISWLIRICEEVGWEVEQEALRIPSTRNCAIICRRRRLVEKSKVGSLLTEAVGGAKTELRNSLIVICSDIIRNNGGMDNFLQRAWTLTTSKPRTH